VFRSFMGFWAFENVTRVHCVPFRRGKNQILNDLPQVERDLSSNQSPL
jgi:hypothetical protein